MTVTQPIASLNYPQHLLSTVGLAREDVTRLFDLAESYLARNRETDKKHPVLKGRTLINLFYEHSTRTRTSFELAGKRLGMDVININTAVSSASKGESLRDAVRTLAAMRCDALAIRHPASGSAELVAHCLTSPSGSGRNDEASSAAGHCAVINAGDGAHQHPTQALLDAFTICRRYARVDGLQVAICGDIAHSRVARSNIALLNTLGAQVRLIAPPQLMPPRAEQFGCALHDRLETGIHGANVVMMLRVQRERVAAAAMPTVREYFTRFGLTHERLAAAAPDALVLHPGPINRGVEISGELADDLKKNAILDQVEAGVAIRQAVLAHILNPET